MIKLSSQVLIGRPVEQVFGFTSDFQKLPQWTDMRETELVSDGPYGAGSTVEATMKMGPLDMNMTFEITEYEVDRKLSYRGTSPSMDWDGTYAFEAQDGPATQVYYDGELRLKGLWRLVEPFMASEAKNEEARELERLKELLEANS